MWDLQDKIVDFLLDYGVRIAGAIAILVIGLWLINVIVKFIKKALIKSEIDLTLHTFLLSLVKISLRIILFISVASVLGIPTTSFIAVLGAVGLALSLAVKDTLSNFASGMIILWTKPFKVNNIIEAESSVGKVIKIDLFFTKLETDSGDEVIIPNGKLVNAKVINYVSGIKDKADE